MQLKEQRAMDEIQASISPSMRSRRLDYAATATSHGSNSWEIVDSHLPIQTESAEEEETQPTPQYSLNHVLNTLADESSTRANRNAALRRLDSLIDEHAFEETTHTTIHEVVKSLLRLFVSKSEEARSKAAKLVAKVVKRLGCAVIETGVVGYVMPILLYRVVNEESSRLEGSEEVRVDLANVLVALLTCGEGEKNHIMEHVGADVARVLAQLVQDRCPEVIFAALTALNAFSRTVNIRNLSKDLCIACMPLLGHKLSAVRIKGILAIGELLKQGAHECIQKLAGFREHNVVPLEWWFGGELRMNYFGGLTQHTNLAVRRTFYEMIGDLLLNMLEKYDYETLLMPYLMAAFAEEDVGILARTFETLEKIGKKYEEDWRDRHKKDLFYQKEMEMRVRSHLKGCEKLLPKGIPRRPRLGARLMVHTQYRRLYHAAINEIAGSWKEACRYKASVLMRTFVAYVEFGVTEKCEEILQAVRKGLKHPECSKILLDVCCLIGRHVDPPIWIEIYGDWSLSEECDKIMLDMLAASGRGLAPSFRNVYQRELQEVAIDAAQSTLDPILKQAAQELVNTFKEEDTARVTNNNVSVDVVKVTDNQC